MLPVGAGAQSAEDNLSALVGEFEFVLVAILLHVDEQSTQRRSWNQHTVELIAISTIFVWFEHVPPNMLPSNGVLTLRKEMCVLCPRLSLPWTLPLDPDVLHFVQPSHALRRHWWLEPAAAIPLDASPGPIRAPLCAPF